MNIRYVASETRTVQGSKFDVFNRYADEWSIREQGGGNGNWILTKKSDILIDGESYRKFVLDYYNKSRLTENLFIKFKTDLANNNITI